MHGEYVDRTIVQDTKLYYFDANTFDKDSCFYHHQVFKSCVYTPGSRAQYYTFRQFQILECSVEIKDREYNSIRY